MKEYLRFETELFMRDRKNGFLFLGVALFLIGLLFYIPYQQVNDIYNKTQNELHTVRNAISSFPVHIVEENSDEYPVYGDVLKESQLIGSQEVALTFYDDLNEYTSIGLELAQSRIQAHEKGYESFNQNFFVPLEQSLRESVYYQALEDQNQTIERDAQSSSTYLVLSITALSSVFFLFLLLLTSDILTKDDAHHTIIQAYPINASQRLIGKLVVYLFTTMLVLTGLFGLAYIGSLLLFDAGSMQYPRVIYTLSGYEAVSTGQFILRSLLISAGFVIHTVLLAAVLNSFLKNRYLTLFFGSSLLLISFLFSGEWTILAYTPISYLNPIAVLTGTAGEDFGQSGIVYSRAILIYSLRSLIYLIILSIYFSKKHRLPINHKEGGE